jgi:hypothetical protein
MPGLARGVSIALRLIQSQLYANLTAATKIAVREMTDFLMTEKHLTPELVDENDVVHRMIPKLIFTTKQ